MSVETISLSQINNYLQLMQMCQISNDQIFFAVQSIDERIQQVFRDFLESAPLVDLEASNLDTIILKFESCEYFFKNQIQENEALKKMKSKMLGFIDDLLEEGLKRESQNYNILNLLDRIFHFITFRGYFTHLEYLDDKFTKLNIRLELYENGYRNLESDESIIDLIYSIDPLNINRLWVQAATKSHLYSMKYMHKNYLRQLYSYAIKLSLADAVFGGFENLLKYLLKNFSFTSQDLSFELTKAAKNGHENVVSLLLSKIDRLQEESLIRALEFCIEKNHQNIIRILLSEGRTVTDDNKDHLIQTANNFRNSFALELLNSILC